MAATMPISKVMGNIASVLPCQLSLEQIGVDMACHSHGILKYQRPSIDRKSGYGNTCRTVSWVTWGAAEDAEKKAQQHYVVGLNILSRER